MYSMHHRFKDTPVRLAHRMALFFMDLGNRTLIDADCFFILNDIKMGPQ
jgi:hypothetical protein